MAACAEPVTKSLLPAASDRASEIVALQRYAELIKQQEQLIELLKVYTPEQMIAHLSHCAATQWPCFEQFSQQAGHCSPEKMGLFLDLVRQAHEDEGVLRETEEIFTAHSLRDVLTAAKARYDRCEYQKKYREANRGILNEKSAQGMRKKREKNKNLGDALPVSATHTAKV